MNLANETLRVIQKQKAEVKKELSKPHPSNEKSKLIKAYNSLSDEEQKWLDELNKVM